MVKEDIVLGHKISKKGLKVDKAKIKVIEKLPPPCLWKVAKVFLDTQVSYRWFIKDFSKITHPLCKLLEKEIEFYFDEACMKVFECLTKKLMSAPAIISLDWIVPFENMCDVRGVALGFVLGQKCNKIFQPIYYISEELNPA